MLHLLSTLDNWSQQTGSNAHRFRIFPQQISFFENATVRPCPSCHRIMSVMGDYLHHCAVPSLGLPPSVSHFPLLRSLLPPPHPQLTAEAPAPSPAPRWPIWSTAAPSCRPCLYHPIPRLDALPDAHCCVLQTFFQLNSLKISQIHRAPVCKGVGNPDFLMVVFRNNLIFRPVPIATMSY